MNFKILIVDDSPTVRITLEWLLAHHGYCVFLAEDGMDALNTLSQHNPDLILLDIAMPRIDGMQLLQVLRQGKQFAATPIIMISGRSDKAAVNQAMTAGATDFIAKPVLDEALLNLISSYLYSGVGKAAH